MVDEIPEDPRNWATPSSWPGMPDCEPSERFCKMLAGLPEQGRQEALRITGEAIGWRPDFEEAIQSPDSAAAILGPPTLEQVRKRLRHLVGAEHVFEPMLLPGLQHFLVCSLRAIGERAAASNAIDRDLEQLRNLEEWKTMPLKDRPAGCTDDLIERAIPAVQAKMTKRTAECKRAAEMAGWLENEWENTFTPEYWRDWLKRGAEEG